MLQAEEIDRILNGNVHAEARRFLRSLIDDETRCEEWVASLGLPHHGIYWRRNQLPH